MNINNYRVLLEHYKGNIYDLDAKQIIKNNKLIHLIVSNSSALKREGIVPLERVALVMNSSVAFIVNYFSLIEIGAVPILMSKFTKTYELKNYDEKYGIH